MSLGAGGERARAEAEPQLQRLLARVRLLAAQRELRAVERRGRLRLRLLQRPELRHARAAAAAAGEAAPAPSPGAAGGGAVPGRHPHRTRAEDVLQTLQLSGRAAERPGENHVLYIKLLFFINMIYETKLTDIQFCNCFILCCWLGIL